MSCGSTRSCGRRVPDVEGVLKHAYIKDAPRGRRCRPRSRSVGSERRCCELSRRRTRRWRGWREAEQTVTDARAEHRYGNSDFCEPGNCWDGAVIPSHGVRAGCVRLFDDERFHSLRLPVRRCHRIHHVHVLPGDVQHGHVHILDSWAAGIESCQRLVPNPVASRGRVATYRGPREGPFHFLTLDDRHDSRSGRELPSWSQVRLTRTPLSAACIHPGPWRGLNRVGICSESRTGVVDGVGARCGKPAVTVADNQDRGQSASNHSKMMREGACALPHIRFRFDDTRYGSISIVQVYTFPGALRGSRLV